MATRKTTRAKAKPEAKPEEQEAIQAEEKKAEAPKAKPAAKAAPKPEPKEPEFSPTTHIYAKKTYRNISDGGQIIHRLPAGKNLSHDPARINRLHKKGIEFVDSLHKVEFDLP